MRASDRDLIRGGHYGQRSCEPHSKAEHMAAPTNAAFVKKALANPEPSTHGPGSRRGFLLGATRLSREETKRPPTRAAPRTTRHRPCSVQSLESMLLNVFES